MEIFMHQNILISQSNDKGKKEKRKVWGKSTVNPKLIH